jgi:hypothetical protein
MIVRLLWRSREVSDAPCKSAYRPSRVVLWRSGHAEGLTRLPKSWPAPRRVPLHWLHTISSGCNGRAGVVEIVWTVTVPPARCAPAGLTCAKTFIR